MDLQYRLNAELDHACLCGDEQSVTRLIHVGADPIHDNGNALLCAVCGCTYPIVKQLLDCDVYKDPSAKTYMVKAYKHFKERKFDDDDISSSKHTKNLIPKANHVILIKYLIPCTTSLSLSVGTHEILCGSHDA